jgi:hypothetical protein
VDAEEGFVSAVFPSESDSNARSRILGGSAISILLSQTSLTQEHSGLCKQRRSANIPRSMPRLARVTRRPSTEQVLELHASLCASFSHVIFTSKPKVRYDRFGDNMRLEQNEALFNYTIARPHLFGWGRGIWGSRSRCLCRRHHRGNLAAARPADPLLLYCGLPGCERQPSGRGWASLHMRQVCGRGRLTGGGGPGRQFHDFDDL